MQTEAMIKVIESYCRSSIVGIVESRGEVTVDVKAASAKATLKTLRDHPELCFEQLIDLCGVDYSAYGVESNEPDCSFDGAPKLAVVYHLQSLKKNHRLRVRVTLDDTMPLISSVVGIWAGANWFEREAFDMYGIIFEGHPDLRRLLTDYGFIGHPFRKDFPVSGHVEMRYDEEKRRVVYQPVSIEPRVLVPRVIREDGYRG
jgi:NADH-quinone oxidoreductase subunit C